MRSNSKPVILSTGLASENELSEALSTIQKYHNQIIIYVCFATLLQLRILTYHYSVAEDPFWLLSWFVWSYPGSVAAMSATALGAVMVEKLFKLDNDTSSVDPFSMKIGDCQRLKNLMETYSLFKPYLEIPDVAKVLFQANDLFSCTR